MITTERMSEQFEKLHLQIGKFPITLHHFTGPDVGDPHDHPFSFVTTVIAGGYVDEAWYPVGNEWRSRRFIRHPGTSHTVLAKNVHRIVELLDGECITSVVWLSEGKQRREPRFYRLIDGVMRSRQWNEPEFPSTPTSGE